MHHSAPHTGPVPGCGQRSTGAAAVSRHRAAWGGAGVCVPPHGFLRRCTWAQLSPCHACSAACPADGPCWRLPRWLGAGCVPNPWFPRAGASPAAPSLQHITLTTDPSAKCTDTVFPLSYSGEGRVYFVWWVAQHSTFAGHSSWACWGGGSTAGCRFASCTAPLAFRAWPNLPLLTFTLPHPRPLLQASPASSAPATSCRLAASWQPAPMAARCSWM